MGGVVRSNSHGLVVIPQVSSSQVPVAVKIVQSEVSVIVPAVKSLLLTQSSKDFINFLVEIKATAFEEGVVKESSSLHEGHVTEAGGGGRLV